MSFLEEADGISNISQSSNTSLLPPSNVSIEDLNKLNTFQFITEGILLTIVSAIGFIGNVMSVIVLIRTSEGPNQNASSFSNLLQGLATFDALFLLIAIISFGMPQLSEWYSDYVFVHIMPVALGLLHTFRVGSVYVTLSVTFERFHAIICPLRLFRWKKYLLTMSVAFSFIYNIPKYFEMKVMFDPEYEQYYVISTPMRLNPTYMSLYVFWSKFLLIEMLPYTLILVLNIIIIHKITKSAKFRGQFTLRASRVPDDESSTVSRWRVQRSLVRRQQDEHKLGWILVGMSTLFILCQSLKIIPDLYEVIVCNEQRTNGQICAISSEPIINMITRLSHLLVCFNLSANFIFYYLNGAKFRKAWVKTYGNLVCFKRFKGSGMSRQSDFRMVATTNNALLSQEIQA